MSDRQLIADLLSALEYHTEQTRPIEFSRVAIEAASEYLRKPAQPSKPWVGLTPKDKSEIEKSVGITENDDGWMVSQMFTLTEAKLKEKNNG